MKKSFFAKVLSLVLVGLMALSCVPMAAGAEEVSENWFADSGIDVSQPVTITMLVLGNKPTNGRGEAAIAKENELLKELVNAEVQLQYIEWADWQTNYQLALASGDSTIDLIITATDWLYAWPSARKGAFLALTEDMLSTYAPKTWEAVPEAHWDECSLDGSIWFAPEDQYTQYTNHGIYWRADWAAEGGVAQVTTFPELGDYFAAVKENHPEAYPWDASAPNNLGGLLPGYLQDNTQTVAIMGTETGNFNLFAYDREDPYTVVSPYMDGDEMVDGANLMKEWADAGYWREDVLNYQGETRELMYAGSSGADQHHTETYVKTTRPNMDLKQPGSDLQFFYWGMANGNYNRDLITHGAMAVSAFSKNPERALMVYDLMRNHKEIYQFHNLGIEGVDYIDNGDGSMSRPEGFDATTDLLDTNFWAGRMDAFNLRDVSWYDKMDDVFAQLDSQAGDYALGKFVFDSSAVEMQKAALADVCATYITALAYGKAGDGAEAVQAFRDALKAAGYDAFLAEIQRQLDDLKAAEG